MNKAELWVKAHRQSRHKLQRILDKQHQNRLRYFNILAAGSPLANMVSYPRI
jgi:hypothetical protein